MKILNYKQAIQYLNKSIPKGKLRYPGKTGLDRQIFLLKCLDNPQNRYPVIHIAGTSGKGSTASYLSYLLENHGFKVGLTVSPHIFDIKERIQINNKFISEKDFVILLNKIIPAVEKTKEEGLGKATYFEIMVCLFYLAFYYYKVDYAVIETGMGGLMDGTNVIDSEEKIAVITRLGLDHTGILGNNISEIASQKAGIIKKKNTVVSLWQIKKARMILEKVAKKNETNILYIKNKDNYKNICLKDGSLVYDFSFKELILKKLLLKTIALYQVENSALALSALKLISEKFNFEIDEKIIRETLIKFKLIGRMNCFDKVIFDGAHNPQKMNSFIKSLKLSFPNKKFIFVVAFKQKKESKKMLSLIIPMASKIILTSFVVKDQDMMAVSQTNNRMIETLKSLNFNEYQIIENPEEAVKKAMNESKFVAITGSLYLFSKINLLGKEE